MAADTPQIETAEASITPNSSSTFNFLDNHNEKNQTTLTTNTACKIPGSPALIISVNNTLLPRMTSPVFIKNSERAASFNHAGSLKTLLNSNPATSAKTTYSMP